MLRQGIDQATDVCAFAGKWGITTTLAMRLQIMQRELGLELWMVSGFRSRQQQLEAGPDAAAFDVSTHTSCPATGADLNVGSWLKATTPDSVKAQFGRAATFAGLRWGGGSPVDPRTGIPSDWNHVDEGPRRR